MAGLGISDIALGRGDTANRATASTIDKSMTDRCKDFQAVIETFINEFMFKELLFEGGYIIDEKEDSFVKIKFREIDIDFMLKVQNHSVFKYEHHAISETEMREEISRDPIGDDKREDMYFERVQAPLGELETEAAVEIAEAKGVGKAKVMSKNTTSSITKKAAKSTNNRNKPTNQHGTKPAKTSSKRDYEKLASLLDHSWHLTKLDIVDMVNDMDSWKGIDIDKIRPIVNLTYGSIREQTAGLNIDHVVLEKGIGDAFNDLGDLLCRNINSTEVRGELVYKISGVFESLRFRLNDLAEKVVIEEEEHA
jgi:hypothetical protein